MKTFVLSILKWPLKTGFTGPCSAVGNMSGNRCESDFRSRDLEFDPRPVPYFRGDWSWNNFYGHSPPFRWIIQEGLLSVTSESMCTKYWLTACSSLPRKNVVRWIDRPAMTIAVDLGRKATKQTKNKMTGFTVTTIQYSNYICHVQESIKVQYFLICQPKCMLQVLIWIFTGRQFIWVSQHMFWLSYMEDINVSKIDENRCKQTQASLPWFWACR